MEGLVTAPGGDVEIPSELSLQHLAAHDGTKEHAIRWKSVSCVLFGDYSVSMDSSETGADSF